MGLAAEEGAQVRRVVCNTGPLLHLREARGLELLAETGHVFIPHAVDMETVQHAPDWRRQRPKWLVVETLVRPFDGHARAWEQAGLLDAGEAEVVALARQLKADWLLTDDAAARLFAEALGMEVHGSLGVVLWAAGEGRLNRTAAHAILNRLARSSLWISERVLVEAKSASNQLAR